MKGEEVKTGRTTNQTNHTNQEPSSLVLDSPGSAGRGNPGFRGFITAGPRAPFGVSYVISPFVLFVV